MKSLKQKLGARIQEIRKSKNLTQEVEEKELFNFGHIKSRDELIKLLNNSINNASDNELKYLYKVVEALKYLKT